jgi:hypothetical protein
MAIDAACSRRATSTQRNETDASSPRSFARRLLAVAGTTSPRAESATVRVYEKLRQQLCAPVGVDGFQMLASRALRLSKSKSPKLSTVQLTAAGTLRGLDEIKRQTDEAQNEVGVILVAQLIEQFVIFLGEATTLQLIEGVHLEFEVRPESDATDSAAAEDLENLMREADRLRSGSERLQALANKHPGIGYRLVGVADRIRKLAMVLDVFALIPSTPEGPREGALARPLKRYVM